MCLIITPIVAQSTTEIRPVLDAYIQAMEQKDWETVTNHTYSGIFDYVSRDQFLSMLALMDNPSMITEFSNMKITEITDPYISGSGQYIMIRYTMNMQIQLKGEQWSTEVIDQTIQTISAEYGNANYDPMARMINSAGTISLLAINDPKTSGSWKFAENSNSLREILGKSIPPDVFSYFSP